MYNDRCNGGGGERYTVTTIGCYVNTNVFVVVGFEDGTVQR